MSEKPTSFRRRYGVALTVFVLLPCAFAIGYAASTGKELLTTVLTIPVLIVAGLTLWQALPKPAQLVLVRQDELSLDDLIFYVVPQPNPQNEQRIPRDYLLQLHVAVCNIGDKKAVLSRVRLEGFRGPEAEMLSLPDAPTWLDGAQWSQHLGWVNGELHHQNVWSPPPYVLDRDDVITIRFRCRRGIDWSERWTLEELRRVHDALRHPFAYAYGHMAWRRGQEIITEPFEVALCVQQQQLYAQTIADVTQQFTERPHIPEHPFQLE